MSNKKVLGAKPNVYDNIEFKSILEKSCYKKLKEAKLNFAYESEKILIWERFDDDEIVCLLYSNYLDIIWSEKV